MPPPGASEDSTEPERLLVERNADLHARVAQMERAVESHAVVNQAQGILMAVHRIDANAAWAALLRVSSHTNFKLRLLAEAVVDLMSTSEPTVDGEVAAAAVEMLLPQLRDLEKRE